MHGIACCRGGLVCKGQITRIANPIPSCSVQACGFAVDTSGHRIGLRNAEKWHQRVGLGFVEEGYEMMLLHAGG